MTLEKDWKVKNVPLFLHGDGVEFQNRDSLMCFSFGSLLSNMSSLESHWLCAAFPKSCTSGDTWPPIWKYLKWSFEALGKGYHPVEDPDGKPLEKGSPFFEYKGQPLHPQGLKGRLWSIIGDQEFFSNALGLPHWNSHYPCHECDAENWEGCTLEKEVKEICLEKQNFQEYSHAEHMAEPASDHPLFQLDHISCKNVRGDPLHILFCKGLYSHLIGGILHYCCWREGPGKICKKKPWERLSVLFEQIQVEYSLQEATTRLTNLKLSMFTDAQKPWSKWANLDVKGGEAKHLLPALIPVIKRLFDKSRLPEEMNMILAAESLEKLVNLWDLMGIIPTDAEFAESMALGKAFLDSYHELNVWSLEKDRKSFHKAGDERLCLLGSGKNTGFQPWIWGRGLGLDLGFSVRFSTPGGDSEFWRTFAQRFCEVMAAGASTVGGPGHLESRTMRHPLSVKNGLRDLKLGLKLTVKPIPPAAAAALMMSDWSMRVRQEDVWPALAAMTYYVATTRSDFEAISERLREGMVTQWAGEPKDAKLKRATLQGVLPSEYVVLKFILGKEVTTAFAEGKLAGVHAEGVKKAWPWSEAMERIDATLLWLDAGGRKSLSTDIVLPHCREDLSWLGNSSLVQFLPARTRVFIYEKCGGDETLLRQLQAVLPANVQLVFTRLDDSADPATGQAARRDECTAYLSHVVMHWEDLAEVTLFLHGDPSDHTPFGLLNLVFRGLTLGTFGQLDFVHLGSPRLVATYNPCQDDIYQRAFGRPSQHRLFTYCCSQFLVSKRRIRARPLGDYVRMLQLVDGTVADQCERIGPSYEKYAGQRLSHCFFLEFMWHVVFGQDDELPSRADDVTLPVSLRLKDNEERPPSIWKSYVTPFIGGHATFQGQGHENWRKHFNMNVDLGRPIQKNFGDGYVYARVELSVQLPEGYPATAGPQIELKPAGELSEEALPAELLQGSLEPLVANTLEECQGMVALFMVAEAVRDWLREHGRMERPAKEAVSATGTGNDAICGDAGDDFDVDSEDLDGELIDALLEVIGAGCRVRVLIQCSSRSFAHVTGFLADLCWAAMLFALIEQICSFNLLPEIQAPVSTATVSAPKRGGHVRPQQVPPLKLWHISRSVSTETIPTAPTAEQSPECNRKLEWERLQEVRGAETRRYVEEDLRQVKATCVSTSRGPQPMDVIVLDTSPAVAEIDECGIETTCLFPSLASGWSFESIFSNQPVDMHEVQVARCHF
eukprot:s1262_g9.t1